MITYLKTAIAAAAVSAGHEQVSETVRGIIADIRDRGDAAVREYSERFDHWSPGSFLLDPAAVDRIIGDVPAQVIEDIETVQSNVRRFAQVQRDTLADVEIETAPGIHLGQKHIPTSRGVRTCRAVGTR